MMPGQLALFDLPALRNSDLHCRDCGVDCGVELPVVRNELWPQGRSDGSPGPMDGVLCRECFERRLGRPLEPGDLLDFPVDGPWWGRWGWDT
jgi:hypothetical protein